MKSMPSLFLISSLLLTTLTCLSKKEKPVENISSKNDLLEEYQKLDEPRIYQPNPVILNSVGQLMNGALSIAQDPHNRPNIGHSVAAMIHAIICIIVEKLAHKKMDPNHLKAFENCCDEICSDMNKEIAEIIVTKSFMLQEN